MDDKKTTISLFTIIVIFSLTTWTDFGISNRYIAYSLLTLSIILSGIYFSKKSGLVVPKSLGVLLLMIILIIYIIHAFKNPWGDTLFNSAVLRVPLFIFFTSMFMFLIPNVVNWKDFTIVISAVSSIVIILSLPTLIIDEYNIAIFSFNLYDRSTASFIFDFGVLRLEGPFFTPNAMGMIALFGTITSICAVTRNKSLSFVFIVALNSLGLLLSGSRGAIVAGIVGVITYVFLTLLRENMIKPIFYTLVLIFTSLISLELHSDQISALIGSIDFSGRVVLTSASVQAAVESPLIGYGPGDSSDPLTPFIPSEYPNLIGDNPHNSYARMLVDTGLLGGTSYIVFHLWLFCAAMTNSITKRRTEMLTLFAAICVSQLTQQYSLFGVNSSTLIAAIGIGFLLMDVNTETSYTDNRGY